ncbi:MAG: hypothetical protein COW24_02710 [Candidatus Kerfeldbacteria bacterium CG15_BIG_FIL_POST_REV_8_21_14_020_45_12]|uniref:Glycosyltransferase 2-like domain-containing protein n=1 Tax=Candidatus Kerfeldbacteria bacterium CG15_BIG_FIL_POST_REV_8_21_14_020_45_12 TaxID=2014247 RepID=A0A2M7H3Z9_9BACT|nr:MAG: hypothetical protein COW24_02710 [Candidatus Kerfeldbacteria bacterium CG15_BIG_FIL_POST_REV_8_21_14_020_45_12]PJA93045.1 MAG: hypothetical protein CO132_04795 [Candidatus Kerfeldbacteria bacterium CG_4_9_14_3_um_filter_45_8]
MQLSVIIVSWNVRDHLRRCLQSIKDNTNNLEYEVIVVDNASHDGSIEMVASEFPEVKLIASNVNLGFGTANNRGVEIATGEVVFILNDDTVLTENSLRYVYDRVMGDKTIGVLGYHLFNADGSHQDSVRRYPRLSDQLLMLTKVHNLWSNLKPVKRYLAQDFDYSSEQEVDQLMGACMVMRRDVYNQAGGFDENFFVWFEEVDLEKRIHDEQNLRVVYTPETSMIHVKGASFKQWMSLKSQRMFNKSMRTYFLKHYGLMRSIPILLMQPVSLVLAGLVGVFRRLGGNIQRFKNGQS